jgi:hypothetical protein
MDKTPTLDPTVQSIQFKTLWAPTSWKRPPSGCSKFKKFWAGWFPSFPPHTRRNKPAPSTNPGVKRIPTLGNFFCGFDVARCSHKNR